MLSWIICATLKKVMSQDYETEINNFIIYEFIDSFESFIIISTFMNKDFEEDDFDADFTNLKENITIGTAQRRGRKCYTQVKNIP